jgi:hypothetical protein
MPIRLVVNYENVSHRFVKTTKVTLSEAGPPEDEAKGSKLGHHIWDLNSDAGETLKLKIEIPEPAGSGLGKPLLDMTHLLEVIKIGKGGLSLKPKSPASPPSDQWKNNFNPRVSGQLVSAGAPRFEINVDLNFLDVTDYYEKKTGNLKVYSGMKQTNPATSSGTPPAPPPHYDVKFRLLEFTGGQPVCWAVFIPPAIKPDSKIIHATLFFRPVLPIAYNNTDDLGLKEMVRYVGDPFALDPKDPEPENFPFFSQRQSWDPFPRCGFEKQISQANKCALFVHPFPHGALYGDIPSSKFPELLSSICKTLWADKNISTNVFEDLHRGRIALSAFSFGGSEVYKSLKANPKKIDELFLFDPNGTGDNQSAVISWFRLGGKKLRMFGGRVQYDAMFSIAKSLASSDATINPTDRAAWEGSSSVFPIANTCPEIRPKQTLSVITDPTPTHLSGRTGMFLGGTNNGDLTLEAVNSKGKNISAVVPNCIADEAAAVTLRLFTMSLVGTITTKEKIVKGRKFPPGTLEVPVPGSTDPIMIEAKNRLVIPVKSQNDLDHNVSAISEWAKGNRHQWAIMGGDDPKRERNRGATFKGYLQQALEGSSFT